ncbi:MAG: 1-acyl-sn-glycerol-3-phosphate acyltransferase [Myxococcales bacterium]|nr:1-acyl-sn-glycerol-3-phosphate acyltransferase [Myxococcales bacterium]MDH3483026.1 1-acyl-sn-glycerol-3-phosphate acyltransferase [Myxococcales bacterium]
MVKPPKERPGRRRLMTVSLYVAAWVLLTVLAPVWLVAGVVIGAVRRRSFVTLRLLIFAWFFFGIAMIALVRLAVVFSLLRGKPVELQTRLFELQQWWSATLLRLASALLRLDIDIEEADAASPGPTILLVRHASILDTLLTSVYVQRPTRWRVRYILKQELLFDPCLDIVGNALPNYFVDRTGNRQREFDGIRALSRDLGDEGILIYPEGTRFSQAKLARARERVRDQSPELTEAAEALTHVLPPRPGGVLTLLDALPEVDCAFFAHRGLEGLGKIKDIFSGSVVGSLVRGKIWRVRRSEIPTTDRERIEWLYEQWALVDAFVKDTEIE